MDLQLSGKRAVVTGASRGIGLAIADALAAEGAATALVARSRPALDEASRQVGRHGPPALAITADTRDDASVRAMIADVVDEFGGVDILVNSAAQPGGFGGPQTLNDIVDDGLRVEIETKVLGYLRCARAAAPHMTAQGWGRIINIGGLSARHTHPGIFGTVRNVAVSALTKNLADELGPAGINVTVVHPGTTVTERMPGFVAGLAAARHTSTTEAEALLASTSSIGRLVTAAEVANVVTFLASPLSVAINGDAIAVGGGHRGHIHY